MNSEMDKIINIIRALVISDKAESSITDVIRDYRNVEGGPIPYRRFGYDTLEEFLKSSGQFFVHSFRGETKISVVPTEKTAHISKMVKLQKSSAKRRGIGRSMPRTPRFSSDQSWNRSSYSKNYRPGPSPRRIIQNISSNPNNNNNWERSRQQSNGMNRSPPVLHNFVVRTTPPSTPFDFKEPSRPQTVFAQTNGPSRSPPLVPVTIVDNPNSFRSPSLLRQNSNSNQNFNAQQQYSTISNQNEKTPFESRPVNGQTPSPPIVKPNVQVRLQPQQLTPPPTPPIQQQVQYVNRAAKPSIIQDRLRITPQSIPRSPTENLKTVQSVFQPVNTSIPPPQYQRPTQNLDTSKMTSVEQLQHICRVKSYPPPLYKLLKLKNSKLVQCSLMVNGVCYSTYPQEFSLEVEAQEAAALNALNKMKIKEMENQFPMCSDTNDEIIVKIYQLIKTNLRGTFSSHIPVIFQSTYKQSLPNHWFGIIQKSSIFKIETGAGGSIIFPNSAKCEFCSVFLIDFLLILFFSASPTCNTASNDVVDNTKLKLPWDEKFWNLYISSAIKTDEISARLIGNEFSVSRFFFCFFVVYLIFFSDDLNSILLGSSGWDIFRLLLIPS